GEHAQAAGIDGNAFMDAEFRGKVANPRVRGPGEALRVVAALRGNVSLLEPGRGGHVVVERLFNAVEVGEEAVVALQLFKTDLIDGTEHLDGTVVDRAKELVVDPAKQRYRLLVPAPPQVVSELLQGLKTVGKVRQNRKRADGTAWHQYLIMNQT